MKHLSILGCAAVIPGRDNTWRAEIAKHLLRRDPRIWHMAYVAVARLLKTTAGRPRSVVAATGLGALDETKGFLDGIFKDGFGSPTHFIASVHNSMAGKLALEFSIDGPNLTVCDGQNSFASAVASCAVFTDDAFPCLVVAVDENIPLLGELAAHLSPSCRPFLANEGEEGAVAILLDRSVGASPPALRAAGPVPAGGRGPDVAAAELAARFEEIGTITAALPSQAGRSFIGPAVFAYELFAARRKGRHVVCSYSPSSKACAAVELCL